MQIQSRRTKTPKHSCCPSTCLWSWVIGAWLFGLVTTQHIVYFGSMTRFKRAAFYVQFTMLACLTICEWKCLIEDCKTPVSCHRQDTDIVQYKSHQDCSTRGTFTDCYVCLMKACSPSFPSGQTAPFSSHSLVWGDCRSRRCCPEIVEKQWSFSSSVSAYPAHLYPAWKKNIWFYSTTTVWQVSCILSHLVQQELLKTF